LDNDGDGLPGVRSHRGVGIITTSHCVVLLRCTCRTTVNSSRTWDVDISGLPTSTRVSSRGHSHGLATGVSL